MNRSASLAAVDPVRRTVNDTEVNS